MNREKANSLVENAFKDPNAKLHNGAILIPSEPIDLETVLRAAVETEEDEEDIDNEEHEAILEKIGWPCENLFRFYWQSLGPMVSACYLNVLHLSDKTELIWVQRDFEPFRQGIAFVNCPLSKTVMSALFKALIRENGSAFGVELFGSLPSNTHNKVEELVPEKVVRAAYWDWMKWAEDAFEVDWYGMAEEIVAQEKSPIMYPLDLLRGFGEGFNGDAAAWLRERGIKNGRLTERAKRAIFDAYFKQSYGPF